jgi:Lipase (class 3)
MMDANEAHCLGFFYTDAQLVLVPYYSPGVSNAPNGTAVHFGFLNSYNSVAPLIIFMVRAQLELHPDYNVVCAGDSYHSTLFLAFLIFVVSGHSLGGALASLAALSLRHNLPGLRGSLRLFTYGNLPQDLRFVALS